MRTAILAILGLAVVGVLTYRHVTCTRCGEATECCKPTSDTVAAPASSAPIAPVATRSL